MTIVKQGDTDFRAELKEKADFVNAALNRLLNGFDDIPGDLKAAIKYTLESPGKRLRSALVLWCCELIAGKINTDAEIAAAAIEMVHTYSLIHDDLPAMDNDDLRRGRPSCHKAFNEATAILTGDTLLTLGFEVLAKNIAEPRTAVRLIAQLAAAAGPAGMIAGQFADLQAQNTTGTEDILQYIHVNKTAKIFRCACALGAICAGADDEQLASLCTYGLKIGLGFQLTDDVLDISATSEQLGKTAGKDTHQGKVTYPAVLGMAKSKEMGKTLAGQAIAAIESFGAEADILRRLAVGLLERTR